MASTFSNTTSHMQLSERVAMHLREQIVSGELKDGQFLRIDAIAKALGVSPTPVREGLLLLQSESLVRLIPRRGFRVNGFSRQDLLDLFWAQAKLAAELTERAASRLSDEDVAQLQVIHESYEEAARSDDEYQLGRLGHEFHRFINKAAASPRLAAILGSLSRQLPNSFYASIEGEVSLALKYHAEIIAALRGRDGEAAGALMFQHIEDGGQQLVKVLQERGFWDGTDE